MPMRRSKSGQKSLVVVSNRLPISRVGSGAGAKWVSSSGGLVTALVPILQKTKGSWIGWTGAAGKQPRLAPHDGISMHAVAMSASEVSGAYNGFSNRTLWPLYHDAIREPEFDRAWWSPYMETNRRFAACAAKVTPPNGTVWIHDYHLQLAPAILRELRPDVTIGFFLHIPFPPEELFSWLPWRREILEGLLGADLVGFQTPSDARNFSRSARRFTDAEGTDTQIQWKDRVVRSNSYPISIDFDWFDTQARQAENLREAQVVGRRLKMGRKMMLAVDRLDYTKGIDVRLAAYELLLRKGKIKASEATLVQIAAPSREPVFEYARMREKIEQMVGRINGEFSEPGRVAVHYFRRGFTREQLVPYYLAADTMLVTPIRDGMNLVCKEYVATRTDYTGSLVLSEFAGAAAQMRRAIQVNPRDVEGMGEAMVQSLRLKPDDARQRMAILRMIVRRHDVHEWAAEFLEALRG